MDFWDYASIFAMMLGFFLGASLFSDKKTRGDTKPRGED